MITAIYLVIKVNIYLHPLGESKNEAGGERKVGLYNHKNSKKGIIKIENGGFEISIRS
jgi:hypothetical protein